MGRSTISLLPKQTSPAKGSSGPLRARNNLDELKTLSSNGRGSSPLRRSRGRSVRSLAAGLIGLLILPLFLHATAAPYVGLMPILPAPEPVFSSPAIWFPSGSSWKRNLIRLDHPLLTRSLVSLDDILPGRERETLLRARSLIAGGEISLGEGMLHSLATSALSEQTRAVAWLELGESLFRREQYKQSAKALVSALSHNPDIDDGWRVQFWLASALEQSGEDSAAAEAYRVAARGAPAKSRPRINALWRAGWLLAIDNNADRDDDHAMTEELWLRALSDADQFPGLTDSLHLDLAELYFSRGQWAKARDLLDRPLMPVARNHRWDFLAGRASLEVGALDSTREAFERLIKLGSQAPPSWLDEARVALGWIALRSGESSEALSYYRNVSGDRPQDLPPSIYGTAVALVSQNSYQDAEVRLAPDPPVPATDPLFYPWLYALAYCRFHLEKYEEAIDNLDSFRGLTHADSLVRAAWSLKGDCFYRLSMNEDAYAAYNKAVNILPTSPEQLERRLALAAIAAERWGTAARLLGDLIIKYPGTEHGGEYNFWRAEVFYRLGRLDSAREHYRRAERLGADPIRCAYALGWCEYKEADYLAALVHFDRASSLCRACPYREDLFMRRGNCLFNTGDIAGAASAFARAAELTAFDEDITLHQQAAYRHGWALYRLRDFTGAAGVFEEIYRREGDTPLGAWVLYWTGQSHFRLQNYVAAKQILERVSKHSAAPDSLRAQAILAVGDGCFNLADYRGALDWYRRLLEAPGADRPLLRTAHESIFECRGALGEWKEAGLILDRLTSEFPESEGLGEKYLQIADGYFRASQFSNALGAYRTFLEEGHLDDPRLVRARHQMAICHENLGNQKMAADTYAVLGDLDDFRYRSAVLLKAGRLYVDLKENRRALAVLEKRLTLDLDPGQTALSRAYLAEVYQKLDELPAARREWELVVARDSGAPDSLRAVGSLYLGRLAFGDRDWAGAFQGFSRADSLGISSRIYRPSYWAGESAYRLGDTLAAVSNLESFLAIGESEPLWEATARIRLAEMYEGKKQYEAALEQYRHVLTMELEGDALLVEAERRINAIERINRP